MPPIEQARKKERVGWWEGYRGQNAVSRRGGNKTTGVFRKPHGLRVEKKEYLANKL